MPGSKIIGINQVLPDSVVVFSCDGEAQLIGPKKLMCLDDGRFDADFPTCEGKLFHPIKAHNNMLYYA